MAVETERICEELKIENCNTTQMSCREYRKLFTQLCMVKDEERLRDLARSKVKCDRIMTERYGKKSYFSGNILHDTRQYFYSRVGM